MPPPTASLFWRIRSSGNQRQGSDWQDRGVPSIVAIHETTHPTLRLLGFGVGVSLMAILVPGLARDPRPVSEEEFDRWMKELSNWGRWGEDDELGALNLITPAKRRAAAQLVREGITVSLARDVEKETAGGNPRPFLHEMIAHRETQFKKTQTLAGSLAIGVP